MLLPLAFVTPFSFVGFLAMMVLSTTASGRRMVMWSYLAGAFVNLGLVAALAGPEGALGGGIASAAGTGVSCAALLIALAFFWRRVRMSPPSGGSAEAIEAVAGGA